MYLRGQAGQRGYAMAAVLVAVTVMGIVMTALLPVWRQQAQREKEAELVFRGAQYARAIQRYVNKNRTQPPSIDVLVEQKYLRKKYKDPITGKDFQPVFMGQQPGQPQGQQPRPQGSGGFAQVGGATQQPQGGIVSVMSTSKDTSIRIHNGGTTYNQWRFLPTDDIMGPGAQAAGRGGAPGTGAPGQPGPGGPGRGGPGGRGPGMGGPGRGGPGPGGPGIGPGRGGPPGGRGRGGVGRGGGQ